MTRDEIFVDLVLKVKFLTPQQIEEVQQVRAVMVQTGFDLSLPEILVKKGFLNTHQIRLLQVAMRHEEARDQDKDLLNYLLSNALLPESAVFECFTSHEKVYQAGLPYPRLAEVLVHKGYFSAEQMKGLVSEWEKSTGTQSIPVLPAALSSKTPSRGTPAPGGPKPPTTPSSAHLATKVARETTFKENLLNVARRRVKFSDASGEVMVHVVDVQGVLDGNTFQSFGEYLNAMIDAKAVRIVLNCQKIDYVSSAGVGVVADAVRRCQEAKGDLVLCQVPEKVRKVLGYLGLQEIIKMIEAERTAVLSFKTA